MKELMNILFEITEKIDGRTWKQKKNIRENKMTSTLAVCLLLETFFASVLYPKREQLKLTKPWHPLEHWSRSQVISIYLLQVGQPLSVFTFPALTAMMEVVRISEQNKKFVKIKLGKNNI